MNAANIAVMPESLGNALWTFEPSAERVRVLDAHMRRRLSDSVRHIFEQSAGLLQVSATNAKAFLARLADGPIGPLAFSYYSDVVMALEEDDLLSAQVMLEAMISVPSAAASVQIVDMGDPTEALSAKQYASFFASDTSVQINIHSPSKEVSQKCRLQIADALRMIDAADPAASAEIRALLREVVLAVGDEDPKAYTFDGASAFMLWGAIILNANRNDGTLGMVQMIAHETAHNLLFGIGSETMLVLNDVEELYPSPLRRDPRPMDGIYHATFVSARMCRIVRALIASGQLSGEALQKAEQDAEENARLFRMGYESVAAYGKLSPLGQAVMDATAAYMAKS